VPTRGQYFDRHAKWMIAMLKKQMQRSFKGKRYSHKEVCTLLQETTQKVNNRPLFIAQWSEAKSLCLVNLLLGRATTQITEWAILTILHVQKKTQPSLKKSFVNKVKNMKEKHVEKHFS
jgi:hypothetical protein